MAFEILQLVLFIMAGLLLASWIPSKGVRIAFTICYNFLVLLQIISVHLGGTVIDYKFIEHLRWSTVQSVSGFFLTEVLLYTLIYTALFFLLYRGATFLRSRSYPSFITGTILLLTIVGMVLPSGILHNLYTVGSTKFADEKSFHQSLRQLGISPLSYPTNEQLEATAGKNIIVLSLESLEKGFLEPPFKALTPNLQQLAAKHSFFSMRQNPGSGWTSGAMYTAITGMPAFFKATGNAVFQNAYRSKIASLGQVLERAGYDYTYMLGNKEFSGIQDMLQTFGFSVISEKDLDTVYPSIPWGLHDKDLFHEAKKHLLKQREEDAPFALFLSTISSHFPDGIYDERWEGKIPEQETQLEFMTAASDVMIGEFMHFLEAEGFLENTEVFIFPDHLLMGTSPVVSKMTDPRELFFLTTAADIKVASQDSVVDQIDIPKMIIEGAGIETNAKFLTDFVEDDPSTFINSHRSQLVSLNEASLKTANFEEGMIMVRNQDNSVSLQTKNQAYETILPPMNPKQLRKIQFNDQLEFVKYVDISKKNAFKPSKDPVIIYSVAPDNLYAYYTQGPYIGIAKSDSLQLDFSSEEMAIFEEWQALQDPFEPAIDKLYLKSTGFNGFETHGLSEVYVGFQRFKPKRGLNLISKGSGGYQMSTYDTFAEASEAKKLIDTLSHLRSNADFFALVAHDSAEKQLTSLQEELEALGFTALAQLGAREAYVAIYDKGELREFSDPQSYEYHMPLPPIKQSVDSFKGQVDRFIAHAGGEIEGKRYTNSLEALNLNYAKGFRYFELDIIETSDGHFVAAHDWNFWKDKTNYEGPVPVPLAEFQKHKIYDTYTPLGMNEINQWFRNHPEAILVTDKINDPVAFANAFVAPSRLMMELFTIEALEAAQGLGLRGAMASEVILNRLGGTAPERLRSLDVKHVTLSRKNIGEKSTLLRELQDLGIRAYVYHLNFSPQFDETYVMEYEFTYVYGMYADRWPF